MTLTDILISLFSFVFAVSVLVAIHEFGHYIVGRYFGIKVLRFSIGFGRPIYSYISKDKDRTEYCLSMIPLGGYVKFLDARNNDIDVADKGRAFTDQPIYSRIAVLLAGPLFNFFFAIIAYFLIFSSGVITMKPIIGEVVDNSYAADAGMQYGDRIIMVDEEVVNDWETAITSIMKVLIVEKDLKFQVESDDQNKRIINISIKEDRVYFTEPGNLFSGLGFFPWQPPAIVEKVSANSPAYDAGLLRGDKILSIDGNDIKSFSELRSYISTKPGQFITMIYEREGRVNTINIELSQTGNKGLQGFLGVGYTENFEKYFYLDRSNPIVAIKKSFEQTWNTASFTVSMLFSMLSGDVSSKNISGPLSIAKYAGLSVSAGVNQFLKFLALISISLGVINLMPIPVLDGGQIVHQIFEWVKGKPLSVRFELLSQQFGIIAILILMGFAFYNDLFG